MSYLDLHILQTVPPSNLNRDDTGSPKTAVFGGVRRARVSSQAWKRATRKGFEGLVDSSELGYRTTRLVELIGNEILEEDANIDRGEAERLATDIVKDLGMKHKAPRKAKDADPSAPEPSARTEYLVFLSATQIQALAAVTLDVRAGALDAKGAKKAAKDVANTQHSIDIALFGRMVADDATLNVDAAVQVAHALSTHAVDNEFDYYTAVDDKNPREETGAGMIGTVEFNSATLYRFATVNLDALVDNLGDPEAANRAVSAFVQSFVTSMPTGKQNTFANRTLPDAVVAVLRESQPISYVGAFEEAVTSADTGWVKGSAERLVAYADGIAQAYGTSPSQGWVVAGPNCSAALAPLGDIVSLPQLVAHVGSIAGGRA